MPPASHPHPKRAPKAAPNLVLVGPMGAGKSSVGRRLAERFTLEYVDVDRVLEARTGATIAQIFACEGEEGFREREQSLLAELLQGRLQLLATGGGAVLREANRTAMRAHGFVVHLHVDVPEQLKRLARDRQRPLLQRPDREEALQQLAEARGPLYRAAADVSVDTCRLTPEEACARLVPVVRDGWLMPAREVHA